MANKENISIISLGGKGEVGKNMIIIEDQDNILILDAGTLFPDNDLTGVDIIIPDISYLIENKEKIRAIVFSHGHEDHIGAIKYLLQYINPPLYGTDLTMALIKDRLNDLSYAKNVNINIIDENSKIKLGDFQLEFCHVNHSIPASLATLIKSKIGNIIYTGDYKFDQTPINNPQTNYQKIADWGKKGVLALLADSTNAERKGHSLSERIVKRNIEEKIKLSEQRILIATFSTNIDRIQHIIEAAHKTNRKIAFSGYSLQKTAKIAIKLGYISLPEEILIPLAEAKNIKKEKTIILMTGSQGEKRASLTKLSRGAHRELEIIPGDTVFISATPIPGNEISVADTINQLYKKGARVICNGMMDVHASGHAYQEEMKMMINLIKPRYLIPVHGEFRHLYHHAQLGKKMGIPVENIFITDNGDKLELSSDGLKIGEKVKNGNIYINNEEIIDDNNFIKERKKLAKSGVLNIIVTKEKNKYSNLNIESKGLSNPDKNITEIKKLIQKVLDNRNKNIKDIIKEITSRIDDFFYNKYFSSPYIFINILNI